MKILNLDHIVLPVRSVVDSVAFYEGVLGLTASRFGEGLTALIVGDQRISLREAGSGDLGARAPTAGSAEFCFIVRDLDAVSQALAGAGIAVEKGPVRRNGTLGPLLSLYVRDPDGNLVELAEYEDPQ